jgi:hypothetical protein
MLMATDNLLQVGIALCFFWLSSWLIKKHEVEATKEVKKFDNMIDELIK